MLYMFVWNRDNDGHQFNAAVADADCWWWWNACDSGDGMVVVDHAVAVLTIVVVVVVGGCDHIVGYINGME